MKRLGIYLLAICFYPALAIAGTVESGIAERIKKVGSVCVEGDDCAATTDAMTVAGASSGGGAAVYKKSCATCHAIGVANAPKFGDAASWESRIAKGMDVLYDSAIAGMPPGMPAKGLCFTCSDDDLKAAVDYMVDSTK